MTEGLLIAVCEDDPVIRELLAAFLVANGFAVETARDGAGLDAVLARCEAALVVLDWMLPGEDGLSICRRLRAAGVPAIIMLTARDEDADRIAGLEGGADDYVSKPFNPAVLLARIRAVLRRGGRANPNERLLVGDLAVDVEARTVVAPSGAVRLTAAEFDLLVCLLQSPGRVLSRDVLLDRTRGRSADTFDRTIDMQVSRLRRRLEESGSDVAAMVRTVRNAGYMLAGIPRRG